MYDEEENETLDLNPEQDDEADVTVYGADSGSEVDIDLDDEAEGEEDLEDIDDLEEPEFDDEIDGEDDDMEGAGDTAELIDQLRDLLDQLESEMGGDDLDLDDEGEEDLDLDMDDEDGAEEGEEDVHIDINSHDGEDGMEDDEDEEAPMREGTEAYWPVDITNQGAAKDDTGKTALAQFAARNGCRIANSPDGLAIYGELASVKACLRGAAKAGLISSHDLPESTDPSAWNGVMQKLKVPSGMDGKQVEPKNSATKAKPLPKHSVDSGESKFTSTEDSVNSIKKAGNATKKLTSPQAKAILDLVKKYQTQNNQNRQAGDLASNVKLKAMEAMNFDMSEDIARLSQLDESMSEDFLTKLGVIFESAVNTKAEAIAADLELQFTLALSEAVSSVKNQMAEELDDYMGYVVENYFEENRIAIREGVETELSESFISGIRKVFAEHYIEVPEGKKDVVKALRAEIEEQREKNRKTAQQAMAVRKENIALKREKILSEASFDLSMNEGTKLRKLSESVDFKNTDQFSKAVSDLKNFHFGNGVTRSGDFEETSIEHTNLNETNERDEMDMILEALEFTTKN